MFGCGCVLFLMFLLMFVIMCSRVDLFVLFRFRILIFVLGKKFREMFFKI